MSCVFKAWSALILSCPEFAAATSQKWLLSFGNKDKQQWSTQAEAGAINTPWQYDGPRSTDDFFSRHCGFTPSAEAEEDSAVNLSAANDDISVTSSQASRAAQLARVLRPRYIPTARLQLPDQETAAVECIPLSKRALMTKYGWSTEESVRKFEVVRNAFKRKLKSFSIPAACAEASPAQHALRILYSEQLKITIQPRTNFVPVTEVDKLLRFPNNADRSSS